MSNAIKELREYLAKSPSVVYQQDVLEYLPAIEAENDRLRELAARMAKALGVRSEWCNADCVREFRCDVDGPCQAAQMLSELGIEVG